MLPIRATVGPAKRSPKQAKMSNEPHTAKLLLIEDDNSTSRLLAELLASECYALDVAADGATGLRLGATGNYDAILLDWQLPDFEGPQLCRRLRSQGFDRPILLLTSRMASQDIAASLDAGADDYLSKSCEPVELKARLRALLRRGPIAPTESALEWGDLQLTPSAAAVTFRGCPIALTPKEFKLLELLLRNPKQVFDRATLVARLWPSDASPSKGTVNNLIKDLRRKLRAAGLPSNIVETVYGLGYRLRALPPPEKSASVEPVASGSSPSSNLPPNVARTIARYRDSLDVRLAIFEEVARALAAGNLDAALQQQAAREAHNLAGSLGVLGSSDGSAQAGALEDFLNAPNPTFEAYTRLLAGFRQCLPVARQKTSPAEDSTASVDRPLVLAIDDDCVVAERLQQGAAVWGMQIEVVATLAAARRKLRAGYQPDAVVLDLVFPEDAEGGLTLLQELQSLLPANTKIAIYSIRDDLSARVAAARLGSHVYSHKSISPSSVLEALNRTLAAAKTPIRGRVLVVDDDPAIADVIANLLAASDLAVAGLQRLAEFWEAIARIEPDLLILDLRLPEVDGLELCAVVRQDCRWGRLPILAISGRAGAAAAREALAAGADDFIPKSALANELAARVPRLIARACRNFSQ